jgi:ubiquinone/menaquinone biosynthesis C-methylase UbiE
MADPYADIARADPEVQQRLAEALEIRAGERRQREMLSGYLAAIRFPPEARVLDVGCGTGAVTRVLSEWPGVGEVIGVDPSPVFIERARQLATQLGNVSFRLGDARSLDFKDASIDVAVVHTCLCHIPGPERALAELWRVLRPGGWLAVFDGDYVTTTVAINEFDPLQCCADAAMTALVHDRWLARRLPLLVKAAGFNVKRFDGHAYVQTIEPQYLLTLIDRGATSLQAAGSIGVELGQALKAEALRRIDAGEFYGSITFVSVIAERTS